MRLRRRVLGTCRSFWARNEAAPSRVEAASNIGGTSLELAGTTSDAISGVADAADSRSASTCAPALQHQSLQGSSQSSEMREDEFLWCQFETSKIFSRERLGTLGRLSHGSALRIPAHLAREMARSLPAGHRAPFAAIPVIDTEPCPFANWLKRCSPSPRIVAVRHLPGVVASDAGAFLPLHPSDDIVLRVDAKTPASPIHLMCRELACR